MSLHQLLDVVDAVAADVAHGHATVLDAAVHELDQVLAALLRQGRDCQTDDRAVVRRRQAQVRLQERLLDRGHGVAVPGLNRQQPRFRRRNRRHLVHRQDRAEVLDHDVVDQADVGMAGADGRELALDGFHRLLHAVFAVSVGLRRSWRSTSGRCLD